MGGGHHWGLRGTQQQGLEVRARKLEAEVRTGARICSGFWAGSEVEGRGLTGSVYSWLECPLPLPRLLGSLPLNRCHWLGGWLWAGWEKRSAHEDCQGSALGLPLCLLIPPPPQSGWILTMAAGGVGGVTEPAQTSSSPIGQLFQLWPCKHREDIWGTGSGVRLGLWGEGCYLESLFWVQSGKGI